MTGSDLTHDHDRRGFASLSATNGGTFFDSFEAYAKLKGLWGYYTGKEERPEPDDPFNPTASERKEIRTYERERDQAAGLLFSCIDETQRAHVRDPTIKEDPKKMYDALIGIHRQKRAGHRFAAYDALFNIQLGEDETLTTLSGRVSKAILDIKALRPTAEDDGSTKNYTIEDLDSDLEIMAMVRALDGDYSSFVTSLLLLEELTVEKVKIAFQNEEATRKAQADKAAIAKAAIEKAAAAAAAAATTEAAAATKSSPKTSLACYWCNRKGHLEKECRTKAEYVARKQTSSRGQSREKGTGSGNAVTEETATQEQHHT